LAASELAVIAAFALAPVTAALPATDEAGKSLRLRASSAPALD
jgi:hypothetical protein